MTVTPTGARVAACPQTPPGAVVSRAAGPTPSSSGGATAVAPRPSAVALATADPSASMPFVRYADMVVLALALPVFLAAGFPMLGYAAAAAAWIVQRVLQQRLDRAARGSEDLRRVAGITAGSMIGRGWLTALTIFAAGLKENDAGLAAALLVVILFTTYFTVTLVLRPLDTKELPS